MGSLLITLGVVRLALILTCFTSAFVILNNAVPIQSRGRLNGVLVSVVSVFKAIGPALGAVMFAWSVSEPHHAAAPSGSNRMPPPGSNLTGYSPTPIFNESTSTVGSATGHARSGAAFYLCAVLSLMVFALSYKLPDDEENETDSREISITREELLRP